MTGDWMCFLLPEKPIDTEKKPDLIAQKLPEQE